MHRFSKKNYPKSIHLMRYSETLQNARNLRKFQTPAEKVFWEKVRGKKICSLKFNRQFIIEYAENMGNKLYYISDFHNFDHKVVIEIDGEIHLEQEEYDKERQTNIEALGYRVIRFTNDEVLNHWDEVECKLLKLLKLPRS